MEINVLKIDRIEVDNLFGIFNYIIPLNQQTRITILHGPNGIGKTVLLKMIDSFFKGNYIIFHQIPFEEFRVCFDNGEIIKIQKEVKKIKKKDVPVLSISQATPDSKPYILGQLDSRKVSPFPLGIIENILPNLLRVGAREWINQENGERYSLEEIIFRYGDALPIDIDDKAVFQRPDWLNELIQSTHTHFVRTDRLSNTSKISKDEIAPFIAARRIERENVSSIFTVVRHSQDLAERIQQILTKYAEQSQSLDRSFPRRLVKQLAEGDVVTLSETDLNDELKKLEEKRSRLMSAGLLGKDDEDVLIPEQIQDPLTRRVLSIYVNDIESKLEIFDKMLAKIELMQKIINDRFLYKRLTISKEDGFVVLKSLDGQSMSPTSLSSGEQHELVLIYELLFRIQPGSYILIDEPEISLHIAWQQEFLKDLQEITKLGDFDVIIATHAPDIIHDRWDLTVDLGWVKE